VREFEPYAEERAREATEPTGLPSDFWPWLGRQRELRSDLLAGLHPAYPPKVVWNLERLRSTRPKGVVDHTHLALAFAFAWGAGEGLEPERYWIDDWLLEERENPSMCVSFADYLDHERRLRVPLDVYPWPLLVWLADGEVPLDERRWAVERYGDLELDAYGGLFAQVPYNLEGLSGRPARLWNYLETGGPCTQNVQFSNGVMKSLGVPCFWSGGPGHTWPCWFAPAGRGKFQLQRTNYIGNRTGTVRDPLGRGYLSEDSIRLLTAACGDFEGLRRARVATHVYELLPAEARSEGLGLLRNAVSESPFCEQAWLAIATASAQGVLPAAAGSRLLGRMLRETPDFATLHLEVLERAIGTLSVEGSPPRPTLKDARRLIAKAIELVETRDRPDLRLELRRLQVRALAAEGAPQEADRLRIALLREARGRVEEEVRADGTVWTRAVGGDGGGAFAELPEDAVLVGLRYATADYSGHRIVGRLQGLYRSADGTLQDGRAIGDVGHGEVELLAREGYAIGGLLMRGGDRIDGFEILFQRQRGRRLDPDDLYLSGWQGGAGGGTEVLLGGDGRVAVGLHGRHGANPDAIGLILRGD